MKILVISPHNADAPAFYRSSAPFAELSKEHPNIQTTDGSNMDINWSVLKNYDVVFLSRPCRQEDRMIAALTKEAGIPLWVDFDDDLFSVPPDNEVSQYFNSEQVRFVVTDVLEKADVLTVSTEALKEAYAKYNDNIKVLPNAWDNKTLKEELRPSKQSNLILYRGSKTHYVDLYRHTDQLIENITTSHAVDWLFLGFHPWWIDDDLQSFHNKEMEIFGGEKPTNVYWKGFIDLMYYLNLLKNLAPKLMIVPLADNKFNKSKSNIAYIEASYAGAATLAPEYLPEFDRPGVIRYKDEEDFGVKLSKAIKKKIDLKKQADESWAYVRDNLSLSEVNKQRVKVLEDLTK